jgi:hypothetical protein
VRSFIFCIPKQIILGRSNCGESGGRNKGEERLVYKVLMGKSTERSQIRRPRHRCEDGIKMDIREIGWEM